jgi:fatty acid desaturase
MSTSRPEAIASDAPRTSADGSAASARDWRACLSADERRALLETNNWRGWLSIGLDWGLVFAAMALVSVSPGGWKLLSIPLALALIGARQLGFAVLMHEAAHHTLFRNRALNDWAGNWLCSYPVWADLHPYRRYHLRHHAKNWTREDPDLDLANKYPVSSKSMRRKIRRDLSGEVGLKRARAILARDVSGSRGKTSRVGPATGLPAGAANASPEAVVGWRNLRGVALTNVALFALLAAVGQPALYLLWVVAWFTTNSLATRIRSIAEHNMVPDPLDELRNSRTTIASWWERLFIAPNRVNYHLEHHLLMTVPLFQLPKLHRLLYERGALAGALVERGYADLLRRAASGRSELRTQLPG